jgi:hypothetical protein
MLLVPPVPVDTATDASASASKAPNASNNFRAVAPSTALRQCGRLMETMVTGPLRSTRTASASVMVCSRGIVSKYYLSITQRVTA